jgi:hypothetical protein
VNPLGLYDLDRNIRQVGTAYRQLMADWREVLPAQSVCLVVPVIHPERIRRSRFAKGLRDRAQGAIRGKQARMRATGTSI